MTRPRACTCACCARRRGTASQVAAISERLLASERALFDATDNGMHAWIAYRQARQWNAPIPAWVLAYLDGCYAALKTAGGTASAKVIAQAFRLHTRGGGRTARDRAVTARKHLAVLQHIWKYQADMNGGTTKRTKKPIDDLIFGRVAEQAGLEIGTVKNIYYELAPPPTKKRKAPATRK